MYARYCPLLRRERLRLPDDRFGRAPVIGKRVLEVCEPVVHRIKHPSHARFRTMVRFGRYMAGEIVDVIQRQLNNQVGPTGPCASEASFHLAVDERPFENQVSLLRRQPDVHEFSPLDPLAPHQISRRARAESIGHECPFYRSERPMTDVSPPLCMLGTTVGT
jgi:hypothetical protein